MKKSEFKQLLYTKFKDIGTLYFFFGAFSGIIGTLFSVIMRMELVSPGDPILNGNFQFYNVLVSVFALLSVLFFILAGYYFNFFENDEGNLAFALISLCLFIFLCKTEDAIITSEFYVIIFLLKMVTLTFPTLLTLKIILENFIYPYKIVLFLSSYNLLLLAASGENHLFFLNVFLTVVYFNCRYFVDLPKYQISVKFTIGIFLLGCFTALFNSVSLALINLTFATVLTRKKSVSFLDEITLLTKVGLPSVIDFLSKTFVRTSNILFKDLEFRPKLATVLFVISGTSLGYLNATVFDLAATKSMYCYDLLQIYNINKAMESAKLSYIFFKEQNLIDLLNSTIEELNALQAKKLALEKKTLEHEYIGPVKQTRAILRSNAYGILEVVRTRTYSPITFNLLQNFEDFDT